jgi:TolB protein
MQRRDFLKYSSALGLVTPLQESWAQMRIDIRGTGAAEIPISIANFANESNSEFTQVIRADLQSTGAFKLIDAPSDPILTENSPLSFSDWKRRGTDAILTGGVQRLADGRLDIRVRLTDIIKQTNLASQNFTVESSFTRHAAHRIADMVYERLLGEAGVFSTKLAYVAKPNRASWELRIADYDGSNSVAALVLKEPILSPAWAPDGQRIAYVSYETKKPVIFVHWLTEGRRVPIANFKGSNSAPAWSPDGRQLAVVLSREGLQQVYLINADGSNLRRLTTSSGIDTDPCFSPDGQFVYFTSDRGGAPQIYRTSLGGGDVSRVTFKGGYNVRPRISADGKRLAYISQREGGYRAAVMDLESQQDIWVSDTTNDDSPAIAPNGRLVIYENESGRRNSLIRASIDGKAKQRLPLDDARDPAWGPILR